MSERWIKYSAVVEMHLPGSYTKLRVDAGGPHYIDVPTEVMPPHLRSIGSKVLLSLRSSDRKYSPEELREIRHEAIIVEDPPEN